MVGFANKYALSAKRPSAPHRLSRNNVMPGKTPPPTPTHTHTGVPQRFPYDNDTYMTPQDRPVRTDLGLKKPLLLFVQIEEGVGYHAVTQRPLAGSFRVKHWPDLIHNISSNGCASEQHHSTRTLRKRKGRPDGMGCQFSILHKTITPRSLNSAVTLSIGTLPQLAIPRNTGCEQTHLN